MGLLPRNTPRSSSIPRLITFFATVSLVILLIFEVEDFTSQTKTVVGHNLEPTPWHVFPAKNFDEENKISRASTIIRCSYLSCGVRSVNANSESRFFYSESTQNSQPCPEFFGWIHHDLEPWVNSKISQEHLNEAKRFASFRVVILDGKLYVDLYYDCVQSRMMFTIWGLLQLLRRYPGMVPNVDLMFDCMDKPSINRTMHASMPLPLFRYCTTPEHFDIPFPDWSFWGWSEVNIRPWDQQFKDIKRGSQSRSWSNKLPFAFWKGNPDVASPIRLELLNCNDTVLWGTRIVRQDWKEEAKGGFRKSKLSKQCKHRYKIYAEGYAWSVSLKYILSCGGVPLIISPQYEDFLSRGLVPKRHYWPIPTTEMCQSIKFAVDWGNTHTLEAEAIGKAAQSFMEDLSMDRVYDYIYHLIVEYSKLLDFTPVRPQSSQEMCDASLLCFGHEKQKQILGKSASSPSQTPPCTLEPPDSDLIKSWIDNKRQVVQDTFSFRAMK